ncbi:hypothetical protein HDU76_004496 [Blyttiomyces sp. JEL0837]|nr:hypothetical protein HDU76_004496 [Blyttiomyces sp. JEL0837]
MPFRKLPPNYEPPLSSIIPHIQQRSSWDCGLACVSMVLTALGKVHCDPIQLRALIVNESVWTIDLAYLFKHFGVEDFTYYTSYIGVNWQYASKVPFYKDTISLDMRRVHLLFAAAHESGVRVVPMVLSLDDMRRFLMSGQYAILMLVDLRFLECGVCKTKSGVGGAWKKILNGAKSRRGSKSSTTKRRRRVSTAGSFGGDHGHRTSSSGNFNTGGGSGGGLSSLMGIISCPPRTLAEDNYNDSHRGSCWSAVLAAPRGFQDYCFGSCMPTPMNMGRQSVSVGCGFHDDGDVGNSRDRSRDFAKRGGDNEGEVVGNSDDQVHPMDLPPPSVVVGNHDDKFDSLPQRQQEPTDQTPLLAAEKEKQVNTNSNESGSTSMVGWVLGTIWSLAGGGSASNAAADGGNNVDGDVSTTTTTTSISEAEINAERIRNATPPQDVQVRSGHGHGQQQQQQQQHRRYYGSLTGQDQQSQQKPPVVVVGSQSNTTITASTPPQVGPRLPKQPFGGGPRRASVVSLPVSRTPSASGVERVANLEVLGGGGHRRHSTSAGITTVGAGSVRAAIFGVESTGGSDEMVAGGQESQSQQPQPNTAAGSPGLSAGFAGLMRMSRSGSRSTTASTSPSKPVSGGVSGPVSQDQSQQQSSSSYFFRKSDAGENASSSSSASSPVRGASSGLKPKSHGSPRGSIPGTVEAAAIAAAAAAASIASKAVQFASGSPIPVSFMATSPNRRNSNSGGGGGDGEVDGQGQEHQGQGQVHVTTGTTTSVSLGSSPSKGEISSGVGGWPLSSVSSKLRESQRPQRSSSAPTAAGRVSLSTQSAGTGEKNSTSPLSAPPSEQQQQDEQAQVAAGGANTTTTSSPMTAASILTPAFLRRFSTSAPSPSNVSNNSSSSVAAGGAGVNVNVPLPPGVSAASNSGGDGTVGYTGRSSGVNKVVVTTPIPSRAPPSASSGSEGYSPSLSSAVGWLRSLIPGGGGRSGTVNGGAAGGGEDTEVSFMRRGSLLKESPVRHGGNGDDGDSAQQIQQQQQHQQFQYGRSGNGGPYHHHHHVRRGSTQSDVLPYNHHQHHNHHGHYQGGVTKHSGGVVSGRQQQMHHNHHHHQHHQHSHHIQRGSRARADELAGFYNGPAARQSQSHALSRSRSNDLAHDEMMEDGDEDCDDEDDCDDFAGHYVLFIGYDPESDGFFYRDPGTEAKLCVVKGGEVEAARGSVGTDHDVIVVRAV